MLSQKCDFNGSTGVIEYADSEQLLIYARHLVIGEIFRARKHVASKRNALCQKNDFIKKFIVRPPRCKRSALVHL